MINSIQFQLNANLWINEVYCECTERKYDHTVCVCVLCKCVMCIIWIGMVDSSPICFNLTQSNYLLNWVFAYIRQRVCSSAMVITHNKLSGFIHNCNSNDIQIDLNREKEWTKVILCILYIPPIIAFTLSKIHSTANNFV